MQNGRENCTEMVERVLENKVMSIMSVVTKIFRNPLRQGDVVQSQSVPVARNLDPEFQRQTWEDRNPTPHQDEVARMRAINWVGRRAV
jgi:hypothetical protein